MDEINAWRLLEYVARDSWIDLWMGSPCMEHASPSLGRGLHESRATAPASLIRERPFQRGVSLVRTPPRGSSAAPLILESRVYNAFADPFVPCPNSYNFEYRIL